MKLSYIALVPTIFTNIIALLRATNNNIHFNLRATNNNIHFNLGRNLLYCLVTGETVCYAKQLGGHWALMHREPISP